jgi:catechol 2,3-dioxygenase-like lactoylglutathione lyase family enzyme
MSVPVLRVARPSDDIDALRRFYVDGLGLVQLAAFEDHEGFDGLMLGHPDWPYHFEFTHHRGHKVGRAPTPDNLLVFYFPDVVAWQAAVARMQAAGFLAKASYNPYWDRLGRTFEDPDGYRIVLQGTASPV